jgi:hypothetical protein
MQKCLNCDAQISCSCKRRHATDGKLVCVNCIALYEKELVEKKQEKVVSQKDKKDT